MSKAKKSLTISAIFGFILGAISVALILIWFDWKLLLVLFLWSYSNNISHLINRHSS